MQAGLIVHGSCAHMCRKSSPFAGIASLLSFLPHPTNLLPPLLCRTRRRPRRKILLERMR